MSTLDKLLNEVTNLTIDSIDVKTQRIIRKIKKQAKKGRTTLTIVYKKKIHTSFYSGIDKRNFFRETPYFGPSQLLKKLGFDISYIIDWNFAFFTTYKGSLQLNISWNDKILKRLEEASINEQ